MAKKRIAKNNKDEQDFEVVLKAKLSPLIPEGPYQVQYVGVDKQLQGKAPKLLLHFQNITPGTYNGVRLTMFCPMPPKLGNGSKLIRMAIIALGSRPARKRFSIKNVFQGKIFNALVKTVTTDWKQQPIPKEAYYSKIEELISKEQ